MLKVVKLKKEAFRALLSQRTPEASDKYRVTRRTTSLVIADTKTQAWEEFEAAMEKDTVGFKEVLENHLGSQIKKAGPGPGCTLFGWGTASSY